MSTPEGIKAELSKLGHDCEVTKHGNEYAVIRSDGLKCWVEDAGGPLANLDCATTAHFLFTGKCSPPSKS